MKALEQQSVVCPHCWHTFYEDEAWYISRHGELRGDSVVVDPDAFTRFGPHQVDTSVNVVRDPKGLPMNDRACPRCHLQVPEELLERKPFFVGIAGAPSAGKSYFLTSCLHVLGRQLAKSFKYTMSYCDSPDIRGIKEGEKQLFEGPVTEDAWLPKTMHESHTNVVAIDGMRRVLLPKPFMFRIAASHDHPAVMAGKKAHEASFVFYDNAGESFDPGEALHRQAELRTTQHLSHSAGVMFVFDLLQDSRTRARLQGSTDPQVGAVAKDFSQESILNNLIDQIRIYRSLTRHETIQAPLAVCLQKFDAWKPLLPKWASVDNTSIEYLEKHGIAALDLGEINRHSLVLRQLLLQLAPRFVSLAESSFSVVRYFAVSALGTGPQVRLRPGAGKQLVVRRGDVKPFRVTDPLLWMLARWKLIAPAVSKRPKGVPVEVVGKNIDRFHIKLPSNQQTLSLDWEYSGMSIVDPNDGQCLQIPALERPGAAGGEGGARSPAAVASPAPQQGARGRKGLSLDNPEARARKGGLWSE